MLLKPTPVHAIIYLPAVVLIPIAKIVAIIISGFSFPVIGLGMLIGRVFRKSSTRMAVVSIFLLIIICVILVVLLKIANPERPFF